MHNVKIVLESLKGLLESEELELGKRAIKVLVTNLKTQYIIFNIRDFIRQYHLVANPKINTKLHKIAKI